MRDLSRRARGAGDAPSWGRRARQRRGERAPRPSASPRARPWSGKAHQVGRCRPWRAPRPSRACRQCRRGPWKSPRAARRAPGGRARGNRRASTWRERGRVRESGECGPVRERLAVGRRRGAAATDAGREARARKSRPPSRFSRCAFRSEKHFVRDSVGPSFVTREIASTANVRVPTCSPTLRKTPTRHLRGASSDYAPIQEKNKKSSKVVQSSQKRKFSNRRMMKTFSSFGERFGTASCDARERLV